jgi:hypothetical protein
MANTVIGASVQVDFQSVGEMRNALKKANDELLVIQQKFGQFSSQAQEAAQKVIGIKDQIENANKSTNILTSKDKFKNFTTSLSAVANGFSAVQSGMALLGNSGEDLQKQLLKVQAAMAFATSISELRNLKGAFTLLGQNAVAVFRSIKIAIGSTGIGLLVIALGAIVAYWDDIKAAVSGVSEKQKKLNKESEANLKAQKDKLDAISKQENILKLQGKSEEDILKMKIAQTKETILKGQKDLKNNIDTQKAQIAIAKRNKDILQGIITFVTAPLSALLKGIDAIGSAVGKNFDLYNKFAGGLSSLVFDPDQVTTDGNASIKAQEDALKDLENQAAGYELSLKNKNSKASSAKTKEAKTTNDELIRIEKEAQEALIKSRMTAQERELFDLKKVYDEKKKVLEQGGKSTNALTEVYEKQKGEIEAKYKKLREEEEDKFQNIITQLVQRKQAERNLTEQETARQAIVDKYAKEREELLKQYPNNLALMVLLKQNEQLELNAVDEQFKQQKLQKDAADALTEAANEDLTFQQKLDKIKEREELAKSIVFKSKEDEIAFTKATSDAKLKIEKDELANKIAIEDAKLQATSQSLGAISNLVGVFAGESDRSARKVFQIQKALNISQAVVDTYAAANSIFRNAALNPSSVLFPAQPFIAAGIAITTGLANVAKIAKQKYQGASSGGGGATPPPPGLGGGTAPMQPTLSPAVQGQALNANAINNLGNQSLRAYVMNSDIQNNNQRNAYLERNARLG